MTTPNNIENPINGIIPSNSIVCTKFTFNVKNLDMNNYIKGETKEVMPEYGLQMDPSVVHMRVNSGSKIRNLMTYAIKKIKEPNVTQLVWNGSGQALTKVIACAEIMKRKVKGLHQITKTDYKRIEEYWEPKIEGLERLKVNRDVPHMMILLSQNPLDTEEPGYQAPDKGDAFWKRSATSSSKPKDSKLRQKRDQKSQNEFSEAAQFQKKKKKQKFGKQQGQDGVQESNGQNTKKAYDKKRNKKVKKTDKMPSKTDTDNSKSLKDSDVSVDSKEPKDHVTLNESTVSMKTE
ncbi:unnamed protein product [Owenia fusiformis]|uniref:Uncharacterized protein n=1 Tax=Owenia fusiformis TaxID=6347 RepID=A0A8J1UZH3_OWEFU|nr:unnamed protein product [Owenia fusiformis]